MYTTFFVRLECIIKVCKALGYSRFQVVCLVDFRADLSNFSNLSTFIFIIIIIIAFQWKGIYMSNYYAQSTIRVDLVLCYGQKHNFININY